MRLWHQDLIPKLDRSRLTSQHRECCALRGNGWGKKHSTVDYVFKYSPNLLYLYHMLVLNEMIKRKPDSKIDRKWFNLYYRGKNCESYRLWDLNPLEDIGKNETFYPEHNDEYMKECIENLRNKGVVI